MKRVLLLLFILGFSTQIFAQLSTKQVVGKWKYTVVTDQGNMGGTLNFIEKEGNLTGDVWSDDGGTFPFTKVELKEDNVMYFELKPDNDVIKVTLKIDGEKFTGTGTSYELAEFSVNGEKLK